MKVSISLSSEQSQFRRFLEVTLKDEKVHELWNKLTDLIEEYEGPAYVIGDCGDPMCLGYCVLGVQK